MRKKVFFYFYFIFINIVERVRIGFGIDLNIRDERRKYKNVCCAVLGARDAMGVKNILNETRVKRMPCEFLEMVAFVV